MAKSEISKAIDMFYGLGDWEATWCRPGRFDEIFEFHIPEKNVRKVILKDYVRHFESSVNMKDVDRMADMTSNLSPAYLREIALQASILPISKVFEKIEHMKKMKDIRDDQDNGHDILQLLRKG